VTQLISRSGFARLAVEHGCAVVPSFVFGEKWMYHRVFLPKTITDFSLRVLGIPLLLFYGRFCSWLPLSGRKMAVVYGQPIEVEQMEKPSDEYVEEIVGRTQQEISRIFHTYKKEFGYADDETIQFIAANNKDKDQ